MSPFRELSDLKVTLQVAKREHDALWNQQVAGVAHIHLRVQEKLLRLVAPSTTMESAPTNSVAPI